jgi:hypothetical protein
MIYFSFSIAISDLIKTIFHIRAVCGMFLFTELLFRVDNGRVRIHIILYYDFDVELRTWFYFKFSV